MYNKLLDRQIHRSIKNPDLIKEEWTPLLEAISHSYEHYERDHLLNLQSLEICSQELRQYAGEIEEREEKTRAILEAASDGILVIKKVFQVELYNSVAAKYLRSDKSPKQALDILSIRIQKQNPLGSPTRYEELTFSDFLSQTKDFFLYEISILYPDRSTLPVEISTSTISSGSDKLTICIMRDISSRKELERKINIRTEITHLLLESSLLSKVLPKALAKLRAEFDWDVGCAWLNDLHAEKTSKPLSCGAIEGDPLLKNFIDFYQQTTFALEDETNRKLWSPHSPYFNSHLQEESFERIREASQHGLHSYLLIPITFRDKNFGIIEFFSRKEKERDEQLINIFSNIGLEIGMFIERQQAVFRELELQKKLVDAAREAGMMQIATSVLHNVGNALNTLNTSITILNDNFLNSELNNLPKVGALIKDHLNDMVPFLTDDPKGKYLPQYLISLASWWSEENQKTKSEFGKLIQNIDHIKKIISSQQSFCGIGGFKEKVHIHNLLDDLIALKGKECLSNRIKVVKEYSDLVPVIEIDKVKFLQTLLNLLCNAIDAVKSSTQSDKIIALKTIVLDENKIQIQVIDNGCGIDPNHMVKIFSYGFTTKQGGHGFGLHGSSLLIKEMGGDLQVKSQGPGKGAEFVVTLPIES